MWSCSTAINPREMHIYTETWRTGAQSALGAWHFCPKIYVWKINKMPEFYMTFARKKYHFPELNWLVIACYLVDRLINWLIDWSCSMSRPRSGQQCCEGRWRQASGGAGGSRIHRPSTIFNAGPSQRTWRRRDPWSSQWTGRSASAAVWNVKLQYHWATLVAVGRSSELIREDSSTIANPGFHGHRAGALLAASRWATGSTDHQDWGYPTLRLYLWSHIATYRAFCCSSCYWGHFLRKPKAPLFQIGSGWNLAWNCS